MDVRNLIFPMTAGDLVQSAVVVGVTDPSEPLWPQPLRLEVMVVEVNDENGLHRITFRDQAKAFSGEGGSDFDVELDAQTPLLVTAIRRS